jgi:hypothetical protein
MSIQYLFDVFLLKKISRFANVMAGRDSVDLRDDNSCEE